MVDMLILFAHIKSKLESQKPQPVIPISVEESQQANNKPSVDNSNSKMSDNDCLTEKRQMNAGPDIQLVITDSSEEGYRANRSSSGKMSDHGGLLGEKQVITGLPIRKTGLGIGIGTYVNRRFLVPTKNRLQSVWKRIIDKLRAPSMTRRR